MRDTLLLASDPTLSRAPSAARQAVHMPGLVGDTGKATAKFYY